MTEILVGTFRRYPFSMHMFEISEEKETCNIFGCFHECEWSLQHPEGFVMVHHTLHMMAEVLNQTDRRPLQAV